MSRDLDEALVVVIFIAVMLGLGYGCHSCDLSDSHRHLGSIGAPCFANHTCRGNLRCVDDG